MSAKKERRANIAVLISGGGTNLQAILDAEKAGALHSGTVKGLTAWSGRNMPGSKPSL